jgi:hypothetical protein
VVAVLTLRATSAIGQALVFTPEVDVKIKSVI